MKDYYNILGVQPNASEDEIRSAYKKLAMKHHPDRGGDQAQFQNIQEAYSTLTDPERRAQWEHQRHFQHDPNQNGFGFSFSFGPDLNDIIRNFHGNPFGGHFRQAQRNRDLRTTIELDLVSTLAAQTQYVEISGSNGDRRTVQVNIPRGIQTGMQMRFAGHGENTIPNTPPGDLYVDFRIRNAAGFRVENLNLFKKATVNAIDAILGTKLKVIGLDQTEFEINVPSGTQPSTQFRLAQQGLWDINHPVRGDLFVEILIEVPRTVTVDQMQKLQQLS